MPDKIIYALSVMDNRGFADLLRLSLLEDLGRDGDITSDSIFDENQCNAVLISRDDGILAGKDYFINVFRHYDKNTGVIFNFNDGDKIFSGDIVAKMSGRIKSILSVERIALNFLGYLSGIATLTGKFVSAAKSTGKCIILDTRKTLPGYRKLAKYAVKTGGGGNHRMGLYDMVMIKDNHIDAAGSISKAVTMVRKKVADNIKIEVECRNIEEVKEAISNDADIIMLDNMNMEMTEEALKLRKGNILFESSGDMTLEKVASYSSLGVDFISAGSLTHSVKNFNYSIKIDSGNRIA